MSDFKLAKIYKIIPLNQDHESDVYIGSTCKPTLSKRMAGHRGHYKSIPLNQDHESDIYRIHM